VHLLFNNEEEAIIMKDNKKIKSHQHVWNGMGSEKKEEKNASEL
jgi:hypothetical protein